MVNLLDGGSNMRVLPTDNLHIKVYEKQVNSQINFALSAHVVTVRQLFINNH